MPPLSMLSVARAALRGGAAQREMTLASFRARYASDFDGFASLLEVLPKDSEAGGPVPFVMTPIQMQYSKARSPRDIVLKARQVKITTVEQARDLWYFLTKQGAAVRVVCQSMTDHSAKNDLSKRFNIMLAALKKRGLKLSLEAEAVGRWLLPPGDGGGVLEIIEAGASEKAAEKKGRGGTTQRLHVTELAFLEYAGATLRAMKQSVPKPESGSEIVYESTPNGMGSGNSESLDTTGGAMFHRTWVQAEEGTNGFKPHFFPWYHNNEYKLPLEPGERIEPVTEREHQAAALGATPEQLKWYRAQVDENGQDDTDQEYPTDPKTCFLASGRPYFDKARTAALTAACEEPSVETDILRPGANGVLRVFYDPEPGEVYVVIVDTSEGTGGDRGCAQVWERSSGLHCASLHGQFKPAELAREAEKLGYRYACVRPDKEAEPAEIAVERNNHGHACIQELERSGEDKPAYPAVWRDRDGKPGWLNHEVSRAGALAKMEQSYREGTWSTLDASLMGEVRTFVVSKKGKPEADRGAHDDQVMTAVIAWDVLSRAPMGGGGVGVALIG